MTDHLFTHPGTTVTFVNPDERDSEIFAHGDTTGCAFTDPATGEPWLVVLRHEGRGPVLVARSWIVDVAPHPSAPPASQPKGTRPR